MFANLKNPYVFGGVLAFAVFVLAAVAGYQGYTQSYRWLETAAALLASMLIVGFAGLYFLASPPAPDAAAKDNPVANAVAFNAVVFVTLGFAAIVAATPRWAVGSFWGGACLLAGGFVGLLFGIPLQVDKSGATGSASTSTDLLVDTANAASKLVAGAALAQLAPIYHHFQSMTAYLAYCLESFADSWYPNQLPKSYNSSLAGGIILYFFLAGFLAGILLPKFFFAPQSSADGAANGTGQAPPGPNQAAQHPPPAPAPQAGAPGAGAVAPGAAV